MAKTQRTRALEAVVEAMAERGASGASITLAEAVARSGLSGSAFQDAFPDREACLLAAFELGVQRARRPVLAAYEAESRWLDAIKGALAAFLRFLEAEPALGRLLVVYSMGGGEPLLRRRAEVLRALAQAVDRGGQEVAAGGRRPPAVIAEGVVGAVTAVLQNRLLGDEHAHVMDLFGSLVSIVALPYLGAGVARRELERPAPRPRAVLGPPSPGAATALEHGPARRLTYRTACVLRAISDYPGASNREVADRAGIVDQGQASKLLARLHARGLIAKLGDGRARGAPNSWCLTEQGERLLDAGAAVAEAGASPQRGESRR